MSTFCAAALVLFLPYVLAKSGSSRSGDLMSRVVIAADGGVTNRGLARSETTNSIGTHKVIMRSDNRNSVGDAVAGESSNRSVDYERRLQEKIRSHGEDFVRHALLMQKMQAVHKYSGKKREESNVDDSCTFSKDEVCDETDDGAFCEKGTDCTDCGEPSCPRSPSPEPAPSGPAACAWVQDGKSKQIFDKFFAITAIIHILAIVILSSISCPLCCGVCVDSCVEGYGPQADDTKLKGCAGCIITMGVICWTAPYLAILMTCSSAGQDICNYCQPITGVQCSDDIVSTFSDECKALGIIAVYLFYYAWVAGVLGSIASCLACCACGHMCKIGEHIGGDKPMGAPFGAPMGAPMG